MAVGLIVVALALLLLGVVQRLRGLSPHDEAIRALDLRLFREHWSDVWMTRMPYPALQELMFFCYFLYYVLLIVPPVAIGVARGWKAFRSIVLAVMLTYLSCFLFYIAFPVYGPRAMAAAMAPSAPEGFFHALVERARESGDSLGTAFPSSHVAGVVTMACMGWRWLGRGWGMVLALAALAVALSTVYTGNHYVVDAAAGALWVVPLQAWILPRLERADAGLSRSV
jgi:membrane-associated phospholipid phosphatase